jgi:hypothetical protein
LYIDRVQVARSAGKPLSSCRSIRKIGYACMAWMIRTVRPGAVGGERGVA